MIRFMPANNKLKKLYKVKQLRKWLVGRKIYRLDLRAGYTCPYACDCLSKVVNGRIKDGRHTQFRCYAASLEALFPKSYKIHLENELTLKKAKTSHKMYRLLEQALPDNAGIVRFHSSGDFFNQAYFNAWLGLAITNPTILFYGYTKNNNVWINQLDHIPPNMILTASKGGKLDHLIKPFNLRSAIVVYSVQEAKQLGLEIDVNDSHAAVPQWAHKDFALLIHSVQPKGSPAAAALEALK